MAIAADTWVETIGGRLRAHEIQAGMYVFAMDGLPTKVKSVQTYLPQKMYYVELSDGSNLEGDQFLSLPVRTFAQRVNTARMKDPSRINNKRTHRNKAVTELEGDKVKHPRHHNRFQYTIDTIAPLQYGYEDHAVPPFVAGMWFARTNKKGRYRLPDRLSQYARKNIQASKQFQVVEKKDYWEVRPSIEAVFLKDYATIPIKEFPYKYLYGTPQQRLEFLQGYFVMRSSTFKPALDGFVVKTRNGRYALQMIQTLCESLGIKTTLQWYKPFWSLSFQTKLPILPDLPPAKRKFGERHRQVVKVEPSEPRYCVHIETEKPIAVSDSFVPIWHLQLNNKKS